MSTEEAREAMVARVRRAGVTDARVLDAMAVVPRERFVHPDSAGEAYDESPLPIGAGQTISAPDMVARMAEMLDLNPGDEVLEVGAGTGYAAAVLSLCAGRVVAIERQPELAGRARELLAELGHDNVEVRNADGTRGAPDRAPFDAVSVAAMAGDIPRALLDQLTPDGTLVCPVGAGDTGQLVRVRGGRREDLMPVAFVPLTSDQ
ncbi:protein-L-isoaspartate(D-aspartate) O-methyltransferase [Prauserella isguenensis]|uniref:Protein-L-isoaspartate O-methyltransferase n=1 Tax=Prauserella isguenensis TaxID=1470180 RepID=A0A839S6G9_9PSEU|nr:protein-L-isoaspartate(D-aspartate) O-methyltransferase [Prauserella isguenensis]MBB3053376.1 protein-L-isoaspartate(D-aspartate) O-methyltransferase [Prauserella isguenensis]